MLMVDEAMQLLFICYGSFLWIKKALSVFLSMKERAFRLQYTQQDPESELTLQHIEHQMVATK